MLSIDPLVRVLGDGCSVNDRHSLPSPSGSPRLLSPLSYSSRLYLKSRRDLSSIVVRYDRWMMASGWGMMSKWLTELLLLGAKSQVTLGWIGMTRRQGKNRSDGPTSVSHGGSCNDSATIFDGGGEGRGDGDERSVEGE